MTEAAEILNQTQDQVKPVGGIHAEDFEFIALINSGSGTLSSEAIIKALTAESCSLNVVDSVIIGAQDNISLVFEETFVRARLRGAAIVVVGGDGSQCLAVKHALQHQVPLAVLPQGTFNLFALHHGIPTILEQGIETLGTSKLSQVAVSWINDQPFLTGAQFGLYVDIIRQRERHQAMAGFRSRVTAYASGLYTFLFKNKKLDLRVVADSDLFRVKGQVMMLSQNRPHLQHLGLQRRIAALDSKLMLVVAKPNSIWDKLRLLGHRLKGRIEDDFQFEDRLLSEAEIHSDKKYLSVVVDGEITRFETPLKVSIQPRALALFKPS